MKEIIIIGLGPGRLGQLSYEAWQALSGEGKTIYFRTGRHPVVQELAEKGIKYCTFDYLYEEKDDFGQVYEGIVDKLLKTADDCGKVLYGVPGHPMVGEASVFLLLEKAKEKDIKVTLLPGMSFLDSLVNILQVDLTLGSSILDALSFDQKKINTEHYTIFTQVYNRLVASDLKLTLLDIYPYDHPVYVIKAAGIPGEEKIVKTGLSELDHLDWFDHLTSVCLIPLKNIDILNENVRKREAAYPLDPLIDVIDLLLSPQGCPWDRKQDHFSLKPCLLEETYEVIEAIDSKDMNKLMEELGDLLLQIVFHAMLAQKRGDFTNNDVIKGITEKMIRRHPHVFGNIIVKDSAEVLINWEKIKAMEKGKEKEPTTDKRIMDRVNKALSALLMAEDIQKKAHKVGFDWDNIEGAWDKLFEEIDELKEAIKDNINIEEELGDLLFAVVNIARFAEISPEAALMKTVQKFIRRFNYIEEYLAKNNIGWGNMTLESLDNLWEKAKKSSF